MKIIEGPVDQPVRVILRDGIIRRRLEATRMYVLTLLGQPYEKLPRMTNLMRTIVYMWTLLTGGGGTPPTLFSGPVPGGSPSKEAFTGAEFGDVVRKTARIMGSVAEATERLMLQDRMKILQLSPADLAPIAAQASAGLGSITTSSEFDTPFMRELVLYALQGSAPNWTQLVVVGNILQYLRIHLTVAGGNIRDLAGQAAMVRLYEMLAMELKAASQPAMAEELNLKTEEAMRQRVIQLRSIASSIAAIDKAGWLDITNHHTRFLKHPWIHNAAHSRWAKALEDAVTKYESLNIQYTGFSEWPDLSTPGLFDTDITNIERPEVPNPQRGEPIHSGSLQHMLAGDLALVPWVPLDSVPKWVDRMWELGAGTEDADFLLREILTGNAYTGVSVPSAPVPALEPGEFGLQGMTTTSGYPIIAPSDTTIVWSGGRWAERAMGAEYWHHHTLADLNDKMIARVAAVPVIVQATGTYGTSNPMQRPTMLPVFGDLSDIGLHGKNNDLDFLARCWGLTIRELRHLVSSMPAETESMSLRNIAEACRFIGMVLLSDSGSKKEASLINGGDLFTACDHPVTSKEDIVPPFERHYYHSTSHVGDALSPLSIVLGVTGKGKDRRMLLLQPFTALPITSGWHAAARATKVVPYGSEKTLCSAVRWSGTEALDKVDGCGITGWTISPESGPTIWDIIHVEVRSQDKTPDIILMGADETRPIFARRRNAVVSLLPLGMPGFSGPTGDTPAPAVRIG